MKNVKEMTDREIQESLLENSRNRNHYLKNIQGWMVFFGLLSIIGIIVGVYIYESL